MATGDEFRTSVGAKRRRAEDEDLRAVVVTDDVATTYALPLSGDVTIGRFSRSVLMIDHHSISRMHAVLRLGPEMTIEDLGSANGTYVREQLIRPGKRIPVSVGDVLRFGDVIVILQRLG